MKKSQFIDGQILTILKHTEKGVSVSELLRKYGIKRATFYKWRAKYGGMNASLIGRLKLLED